MTSATKKCLGVRLTGSDDADVNQRMPFVNEKMVQIAAARQKRPTKDLGEFGCGSLLREHVILKEVSGSALIRIFVTMWAFSINSNWFVDTENNSESKLCHEQQWFSLTYPSATSKRVEPSGGCNYVSPLPTSLGPGTWSGTEHTLNRIWFFWERLRGSGTFIKSHPTGWTSNLLPCWICHTSDSVPAVPMQCVEGIAYQCISRLLVISNCVTK